MGLSSQLAAGCLLAGFSPGLFLYGWVGSGELSGIYSCKNTNTWDWEDGSAGKGLALQA